MFAESTDEPAADRATLPVFNPHAPSLPTRSIQDATMIRTIGDVVKIFTSLVDWNRRFLAPCQAWRSATRFTSSAKREMRGPSAAGNMTE
jgi:hypothetical protein